MGERDYKDEMTGSFFWVSLLVPFLILLFNLSLVHLGSKPSSQSGHLLIDKTRNKDKMKQLILLAAALLAQSVAGQNMLRFACSQLVVDRVDPLVNPGMLYSPHLHQIVGGNSFNITMDPETHDLVGQSTCTSCSFVEDLSNYWTAVMFFKSNDGRYHRVPQIGNGGPQGKLINDGGLAIYYIPSGQTTAFAPVSLATGDVVSFGTTPDSSMGQANHIGRVSACLPVMLPRRTTPTSTVPASATAAGPRTPRSSLSAARPALAATRSPSHRILSAK